MGKKITKETIEQVAKRKFQNIGDRLIFEEGAKWQQERSYSDIELFTEELKDRINSFEYSVNQNSYIPDYIKEWFEQFKKQNYGNTTNIN